MAVLKRKRVVFLLIFAALGFGSWLLYHRLMDGEEEILDNCYYHAELDTIRDLRRDLKKRGAGKNALRKAFVHQITQKVFPYWYGTKWDYNGTTEMPQKGSIACGYFVTTTLRDMGVPINRVKMAQCASEEMIRSLSAKKHVHYISNTTLQEFEKQLVGYGDGLYIIGLDSHTGFILVEGDDHYFIHSTGWFPFKVVKDKVSESSVLERSKYRVLGKISDDDAFLARWVEAD